MATDYAKWEKFASGYDSDGDEMEMSLKVPIDSVSDNHLAQQVRPEDITMACGKPMTRSEFEAYCSQRGIKPKVMPTNMNDERAPQQGEEPHVRVGGGQ